VLLSLAHGIRTERPPSVPLESPHGPSDSGSLDETGFVALILTSYAAVVARSHWIQLVEAATPALGYVVGEESDVKPAADKV
jgi:hypothetical protein